MALFGASMTHEEHAGYALHAALGIQGSLREYQGEVERGWVVLPNSGVFWKRGSAPSRVRGRSCRWWGKRVLVRAVWGTSSRST
jgi:hypothetical protein